MQEQEFIAIKGVKVPLSIIYESRKTSRSAIGASGIIIRMPSWLSSGEKERVIEHHIRWVHQYIDRKPDYLQLFSPVDHDRCKGLETLFKSYEIRWHLNNDTKTSGSLKGNVITIKTSNHALQNTPPVYFRRLVSRLIARDLLPVVKEKVHRLNNRHFNRKINDIKLKYNLTNWGSCSSRSNINLSTRLLLTTENAFDYVVIHELAHLIEQNHSRRFWALVEKAMPDYKVWEKWLRQHSAKCNFLT